MKQIDEALRHKLSAAITQLGCELVGAELVKSGRRYLFCIYIDKPKGVTIDDCSLVSRQVGAILDVEDAIPGPYNLEVSSPGVDRPLFDIEDFKKFIGSQMKIKLAELVLNKRQFKGQLIRVEGHNLYLLTDIGGLEQEVMLSFSLVERANLIGDV